MFGRKTDILRKTKRPHVINAVGPWLDATRQDRRQETGVTGDGNEADGRIHELDEGNMFR
jgi:glycerol-3-phosphate dehydrogenase